MLLYSLKIHQAREFAHALAHERYWRERLSTRPADGALAVIVAHVESARRFASHRAALLSQLPMLALMVAYTSLSLWIMAQPIVG